jgi:hypothetical protein
VKPLLNTGFRPYTARNFGLINGGQLERRTFPLVIDPGSGDVLGDRHPRSSGNVRRALWDDRDAALPSVGTEVRSKSGRIAGLGSKAIASPGLSAQAMRLFIPLYPPTSKNLSDVRDNSENTRRLVASHTLRFPHTTPQVIMSYLSAT